MGPVLCQTAIPRFHVTELSLDDPEGMFDLGAHHGDDPVDLLVDGVELAALGRLAHHTPDLAILAERKGVYKGRKRTIDREAVQRLHRDGVGATEIARRLGIGRASVYKVLREDA